MNPKDARKDRFDGPDDDSCPDCLHAKDECVCGPEDRCDLRDDGRASGGFGESYAERNV